MKSTRWIAEHDLSLMIDPSGRLWSFRPPVSARGAQPVSARMDGVDLVIAVQAPGVRSGDVDVQVHGDELEIRGITAEFRALVYSVGLPRDARLQDLETTYGDAVFEVLVPGRAAVETPSPEPTPVAV
jgi:HSP20 family molecular chaperone IbpA